MNTFLRPVRMDRLFLLLLSLVQADCPCFGSVTRRKRKYRGDMSIVIHYYGRMGDDETDDDDDDDDADEEDRSFLR